MGDSETTRSQLIRASARLFNSQGYKATSLSEVTDATGYTKGAIYGHFGNKQGLEREALMYMLNAFMQQMTVLIKSESDAHGKVLVMLDYFAGYAVNPPFYGGCPLVNASVELDDSESQLKEVVTESTELFYQSILQIIKNGVKYQQFKSDVDANAFASLIFSSVEGAIVLMKITGKRKHLRDVVDYLKNELDRISIVDVPKGI